MGQIASPTAASPIDGVVARWRVVGHGVEGLRISRPLGPGVYTGAGTGPTQTLVDSPTINTFAVRLPIHVGTSKPGGTDNDLSFAASPPPGVTKNAWLPPLVDGESPGRAPNGTTTPDELAFEAGRRCRPLTRSNRRKRRCTIPNVRGTLSFNGHAGTNKVKFQGRLSRSKKLKPGRYTLTITTTDSAGNRSGQRPPALRSCAGRSGITLAATPWKEGR